MPVVKQDDSPNSHASVIGWIQFGGLRCIVGQTQGVIAGEHTSIPARRHRVNKAVLSSAGGAVGPEGTTASGWSAISASTSSVAVMPTGSTSPQISPTSRPTFLGLLTPTPTNSNSGCLTISAITILPTKPVPHTTTRLEPLSVIQSPSDRPPPVHPKRVRSSFGRNRNVILSIIRSRNVSVCSRIAETCAAIAAINAYATTE